MAMAFINSFADKGADIIWGTAIDESLGDDLRVTLVATGIDREADLRTSKAYWNERWASSECNFTGYFTQ